MYQVVGTAAVAVAKYWWSKAKRYNSKCHGYRVEYKTTVGTATLGRYSIMDVENSS